MPIITISRGTYSKGKEIAEKVAEKLGYECISREIVIEASEEFNIEEVKLAWAIHDAPSILDRFMYGREKYIAFFETALLEHCIKDNVVYHGLAGQFYFKNLSHVLKVRILADMDDRVKLEMERKGVSERKARHDLSKDDHERSKWSQSLYGIDTNDPHLYDLIIHLRNITVDDAVDIICHTAGLEHFQATPESKKLINEMMLSAEVKAALIEDRPTVDVLIRDDIMHVNVQAEIKKEEKIKKEIMEKIKDIPNLPEVRISISPFPYA